MKFKHAKKKALSLLLAAALALSLAPAALAASEYEASGASSFVFGSSGITAAEGSYTGYSIEGTALTISSAGTYIVSGQCSDGSITVKKGTTGVTLVLKGLTLTSSGTAPITCNKSSAVTIVAASGTVNSLTDSAYNNDEAYPGNTAAENAVIKCKDGSQVTICGAGSLTINAKGKNGIKSGSSTEAEGEARLVIKDLSLTVTAGVNDAINVESSLTIKSGTLTVSAADDAIHSDYYLNIGEKGAASGPSITISSCNEGLEAATLNVYSGNVVVHATDDGLNAANSDLSGYGFSLNIEGGSVYVDSSTGDGLDSNGTLSISGGTVEVYSSSAQDNSPLDSDGAFTLSGGTVLAVGSSGMAQSPSGTAQAYVTFGSRGQMGGMGQNTQGTALSISSGSSLTVKDSSGTALYSGKAVRSADYVFFSSDELISGSSYTLYAGGTAAATATAGTSGGGTQPGGNQPGGMQPGGTPPEGTRPEGMKPGEAGSGSGSFTDVDENKWYGAKNDGVIKSVVQLGIMSGNGDGTFSPESSIKLCEVIKIAAVIRSTYLNDAYTFDQEQGDNWWDCYAAYALEQGVIESGQFSDYTAYATREEVARILAAALPESGLAAINDINYENIPDVDGTGRYDSYTLLLYRAGILCGSDEKGTFSGERTITRAETAAVSIRLAVEAQRKQFSL